MNTKGPFPRRSVWALLAMPAAGVLSIPFWIWYVNYEMARGPRERFAADPGMYRAFGVVFPAFFTALAGSIPGLWLVRAAQRRKEIPQRIRWFALLVNGAGLVFLLRIGYGIWLMFSGHTEEIIRAIRS